MSYLRFEKPSVCWMTVFQLSPDCPAVANATFCHAQAIQAFAWRTSVQRLDFAERDSRPIPLGYIFLGAFLIHAPLLLMKLPLKSYDTNFHIFFASHYVQH